MYDQAWTGTYAPATRETRVDVLVERIESVQTPATMAEIPVANAELPMVWDEEAG